MGRIVQLGYLKNGILQDDCAQGVEKVGMTSLTGGRGVTINTECTLGEPNGVCPVAQIKKVAGNCISE